MKVWRIVLTLLLIVVGSGVFVGASSIPRTTGYVDLRDVPFHTGIIVPLEGPWSFYWDQLLQPVAVPSSSQDPDGYHHLPKYWTRHASGDYSSIGRATYALRVQLPVDIDVVSLRVPEIYTSYQLWINGEWLGGRGRLVGEAPSYISPQIVTVQRPFGESQSHIPWDMDIVLQVNNEHHFFAGVARPFSLGSVSAVHAQRLRMVMFDVFVLTLLFAAGIYHLVQFYFRRRRWEFLYFALMCPPAILRRLLSNEMLLMEFFPSLPYMVGSRMLSLTIPVFVFFFVAYVHAMGEIPLPRWLVRVVEGVSLLYAASVVIMPVQTYAFLFQPYLLVLLAVMFLGLPYFFAALTNSMEARFTVLAGFAVFGGGIHDMLVYHQVIQGSFAMDLGMLLFMALQIVLLGLRETRLQRELQTVHTQLQGTLRETANARSAFLSAQIKPHFLFNTLNTIAYLAHSDSGKAVELISNLSAFLRQTFDFEVFPETVPLQSELRILQAYVNVEKSRYGDTLDVDIECCVDENAVELPPFSIQPLVENAIVHGVRQTERDGQIRVAIERGSACTIVTVSDNGAGIAQDKIDGLLEGQTGRGIGLRNVHTRLLMQYGQGLNVSSKEGEGTIVSFSVPDSPLGLDKM